MFALMICRSCSATSADAEGHSILWRSERACALNSLYMLLKLEDLVADYVTLRQRLLKEELSSLNDIALSAAAMGIDVQVAKSTPFGLRSLNRPAVVHLEAVSLDGTEHGHFVVVTAFDDDGVSYVDGTTAEPMQISVAEFERQWSGYLAFIRPTQRVGRLVMEGTIALCIGIVLGMLWRTRRRHGAALVSDPSQSLETSDV
jgi:ABC-type bacteriocin/lantibiotic exporter with double-glycine peptidase domain